MLKQLIGAQERKKMMLTPIKMLRIMMLIKMMLTLIKMLRIMVVRTQNDAECHIEDNSSTYVVKNANHVCLG